MSFCSNPKSIFVFKDSSDTFSFKFKNIPFFSVTKVDDSLYDILPAPCRKCYCCKQNRINFWKSKLNSELYSCKEGVFTTLTFDDEHVQEFSKDVYQRYFKRLRSKGLKFKYFIVGELGETTLRPHFHCLFFGLDITSEDLLRDNWPYGFIQVKPLVQAHFGYVVNYLFKDTVSLSYSQKLGYDYFLSCKDKGYFMLGGHHKNFSPYFVKHFLSDDEQLLYEDRIKQFYLEQENDFKLKYGENWRQVYHNSLIQKNNDLKALFRLKNMVD